MNKNKKKKIIKKIIEKNMSDEQKQRYREAKNKYDKYRYYSMADEPKQKYLEAKNDR